MGFLLFCCRATGRVGLGVFLLAVGLGTSTCWAQEASFERGLLFQVEKPGSKPSYVFGTIHSEDARVLALPAAVQDALDRADVFAMEVVPDAKAVMKSMLTMVYTDGRTLKDALGSQLYAQAVAAVEANGTPEAAVRDFKPWAVITLISVPPPKTGEFLDIRLLALAREQSKQIVGLETIEEQLGVFEALSEAEQVSLLRDPLALKAKLPDIDRVLLESYLDRDLAELVRLNEEFLQGEDPALTRRFQVAAIETRNARMVERMVPLLLKGNAFVAIGALHLPGPLGVLSLLRQRGWQVALVY